MNKYTYKILYNCLPPPGFNALFAIYKYLKLGGWRKSEEKDAIWYDKAFRVRGFLQQHYTKTAHHFIFSVIADRICKANATSILDVGCGSGQLASLLKDKGIKSYLGFDFSADRILHARSKCSNYSFEVLDAFTTNIYTRWEYDTVVCNEFLEHVEKDTYLLKLIPTGKRFLGAVPNYPLPQHVRYFSNVDNVIKRYKSFFKHLTVDIFFRDPKGKCFYLLDGFT